MRIGLVVAGVVCAVGLAGCAGGVVGGVEQQAASSSAGVRLTGVVHGGQNPITGAHVYLFAAASGAGGAGQAAYGGSGIAASANNASVSLLTSAGNTTLDASGTATNGDYYVTTDASGNFSITGDYTCTSGQQVYLYALGGNPGLGTGANAVAGLMVALGNCPGGSSAFAAGTPYVVVNEVSTVAAAYAMAGFATDALHVGSSGTALALTGIANAFANAGNLETIGTGVALATTPAGNGTVPQAEIYTLANILAACVNSNGTGSACTTLFGNAKSSGTIGTVAADTATAAINIAHNPGAGVAALYGLSTASPPFGGALAAQPNDWTVALSLTGGGLNGPAGLAIDGSGNIWVTNYSSNMSEFSATGTPVSPSAGYTGGGISCPVQIAIDPSGNVWTLNHCGTGGYTSLTEFSGAGLALSPSTGYLGNLTGPNDIVIDGFGNVWVGQSPNSQLLEFSNSGSVVTPSGLSGSFPLATDPVVDRFEDVWVENEFTGNTLDILNQAWSVISSTTPTPTSRGTGILAFDGNGDLWNVIPGISKLSVASGSWSSVVSVGNPAYPGEVTGACIDGSGQVWVSGYYVVGNPPSSTVFGTISEFSNDVVQRSPPNGFLQASSQEAGGVAVDGSGNVWTITNALIEIVGAATPVVTPLSVGVKNNMLGTRP